VDYETILTTQVEGVLTITLNRPEVLNAFNSVMGRELLDALKKAERDPSARCLVLTGAGRAFSSGEDLKARQAEGTVGFGATLRDRYNPIILKMRNIEKPVIGSINGVAAGAGCSIALACDIRIASDKASFIEAFVRIGLVPDSGSAYFLPRLVGLGKALEIAFTGDAIGGEDAVRIGLINKLVPAEELESATRDFARRLAKGPTRAIGLAKRTFNKALSMDLEEALEYEVFAQETAGGTADYQEGVAAFLEKRAPNYTGS
jgi:2-(1,2-epoxy-1,2-dihydrophenyl)acetyl-CoA isomerase